MAERGDRLADYNAKRDFSKTGEPAGKPARRRSRDLAFLVQKHAARRLHYDLRLEWNGVLLSWAVTRGPSDDPSEKRLAVRTEDHPLSYQDFEGTIPEGEYGGGTVMLWDRGQWEPLHDPDDGLKEGKLHFRLAGERMQGGWALIRMRPRKKEKRENWLLIKERDAFAGDDADRLTEVNDTSVATDRSMDAIRREATPKPARRKSGTGKGRRRRTPDRDLATPKFRKPQLATLVAEAPEGTDWLHETKFDGYRCLAALGAQGTRLYTRSGLDWSDRFAALADGFADLPCRNALIDGEVVARDHGGESDFSALQQALKHGGPLVFHAFDLLTLDGEDLTARPLEQRKDRLESLLGAHPKDSPVRFSTHIRGHGREVLEKVCEAGGEGIVSKRADAPYRGRRTRGWLKTKCTRRQEFVIGGYSPSDKRSRPFASLLVGEFVDGRLRYRGRVGSGFGADDLAALIGMLNSRRRKTSPFDEVPRQIAGGARWVTPNLVAEIDFTEMTADGHVRHGVFLGLREDKPAQSVTPETPKKDADESGPAQAAGIRISSGDRPVFPDAGLTKLDLARYYEAAGERMAEITARRPLSLVRCPDGVKGKCFYQKHAGKGFPDALKRIAITESDGNSGDYLYITSVTGLVAAAQMGTIEFHSWGARIDDVEKPDRLVFDLDPDEGLAFDEVRRAAVEVRDRLNTLGLSSAAMVTGGKGVHVIVPLRRTVSWPSLKIFANTFAAMMAEDEPARFTATMSKAKRKGKIFIDWLRNERGATAIAPYSVRARKGAPVAVPVAWDELERLDAASAFSVAAATERLTGACPYLAAEKKRQTIGKESIARLERMAAGV